MSEQVRFLRAFFWLLGIFTVGRWALGLAGARYEATHQVFSIVILAVLASVHHAAFARAFLGYRLKQAVMLGVWIGLSSQLVILVSTAASYLLGLDTFFNTPRALNAAEPVAFGAAMAARAGRRAATRLRHREVLGRRRAVADVDPRGPRSFWQERAGGTAVRSSGHLLHAVGVPPQVGLSGSPA